MLRTIVMQDDYIPTSVVDESEASGRKGNSKKQMVGDKPKFLLSGHKSICFSLIFPLSFAALSSSPARGGAFG